MRERRRNLTRRQKIAATKARLNPADWYLCAENTLYYFWIGKGERKDERISVPK